METRLHSFENRRKQNRADAIFGAFVTLVGAGIVAVVLAVIGGQMDMNEHPDDAWSGFVGLGAGGCIGLLVGSIAVLLTAAALDKRATVIGSGIVTLIACMPRLYMASFFI